MNLNAFWGVPPTPKPFRTELPGRIRLRLRNDAFGMVFIRHEGTTRHFAIVDAGDHWTEGPELEHGANITIR